MKKLLALIAVAALSLSLVACGNSGAPAQGDAGSAAGEPNKEVLVMATNGTFPPYEYYDGDVMVGIDVEMAQAVAEKLGMELQIEDMDFGAIIAAVQSGKADMGVAGMTVTEERLENVNFSDSYATGIQVVIVKEGSDIKSIDDMTGKMIGVQESTTGHIYCADTVENGGFGEENVTAYTSGANAIEALKTGKVDCVVIDNEPAKAFVAANEGLAILETEFAVEDYAIAIAKDNTDLVDKVNAALAELKADGTLDAIVEKYIPAE